MNPDKFTQAVTEAIASAQQVAQVRHHQDIDVPDLFKALVQPDQFATQLFKEAGIPLDGLNAVIDKALDDESVVEGTTQYGQNMSQN
ncbi:MAG: hypothetical protein LKJ48_11940, partial [Lactobacillus sp.]|nr:hypothetical protein [Lactobacillus sp.]